MKKSTAVMNLAVLKNMIKALVQQRLKSYRQKRLQRYFIS